MKAAVPGKSAVVERRAEGVRQHDAGGADPAEGRAELPAGRGHVASVGEQHRERRVPARARPGRSTSWSPADGSRRPTSPARGRSRRRRCPRTSRRFRSSTSARACWRRCQAPIRRPKPCCSRRSRRPRASTRRRVKAPEVTYQGDPEFQPIEKTTRRARRQHRQGHHQGRRPLLHVLPGRLVHGEGCDRARGKSPGTVPKQIYEIPVSSPSHNVTYVTVEEDNNDAVVFATAAGLHRHDGRVGLRGVGHGLLLPAIRLVRRRAIRSTTRTIRPTATAPGTTRGPARTAAAPRSTVRTAAPASARATTRAPARMRAARRRGDRTVARRSAGLQRANGDLRARRRRRGPYGAGAPRRPTTRAPARMARRVRAPASTAAGARPACSAATSGRRPRA